MKKGIMFVFALSLSLILTVPLKNVSAKTYWATGGGIGAGLLGVTGGVIPATMCRFAEENASKCYATAVPLGVIVGGGVGFGLGALIGSAFKKKEPVVQTIIDPSTGTYGAGVKMSF